MIARVAVVVTVLVVPLLAAAWASSEQEQPYRESGAATGSSSAADPSNVPEPDVTPSDEVEEVPLFIPDEEALRKQKAQPDTDQSEPGDEDLPSKKINGGQSPSTQSPSE